MRYKVMAFGMLAAMTACIIRGNGAPFSGDGPPGEGGTPMTQMTCYDAQSQPTGTCALTPKGDVCAMGDANHCVPLVKLDVYADDGKNGVCLHLVFDNDCQQEIYADTCIEHGNPNGGMVSWQCWTSSVLPGFTIDVSECRATGNWFHVSTTSSGQLDILEKKCPAPHP